MPKWNDGLYLRAGIAIDAVVIRYRLYAGRPENF
jgi:hypothetical protein